MTRTARCQCGELTAECAGDPDLVVMCHCEICQRKTGSSYNLGAWFRTTNVSATGAERIYQRSGDGGSEIRAHFCPTCGTTVYWETNEGMPDHVGIAVGCFADPDFPAPMLSVYGKRRHRWVSPPDGIPRFAEATTGDSE